MRRVDSGQPADVVYKEIQKILNYSSWDNDDECPKNLDEVFTPSPLKPDQVNGEKKEDTKDNFGREKTFALCLTGVDRYQIEKDIF